MVLRPTSALHTTRRRLRASSFLLAMWCGGLAAAHSAADDGALREDAEIASAAESDAPLSASQDELLRRAFDAVTAMPVHPHVKDRSRAQEEVAAACLVLDQPQRAMEYGAQIVNWRRGGVFADVASHHARRGDEARALAALEKARGAFGAAEADPETSGFIQEWRRDSVRARIAAAYLLLGQSEKAGEFAADLPFAEAGAVDKVLTERLDGEHVAARMETLEELARVGGFDALRMAIESATALHARLYADEETRELIESTVKASWTKLPVELRVETMIAFAEAALAHDDRANALGLVDETQLMLAGHTWHVQTSVPLLAHLARLRHLAGDGARARADADAALAEFEDGLHTIFDIDRADTLRPLAEAYVAMGDEAAALALYERILDEGASNPNARPRAEDLSQTCLALAILGIEPDAEMRARIAQIADGLADPW